MLFIAGCRPIYLPCERCFCVAYLNIAIIKSVKFLLDCFLKLNLLLCNVYIVVEQFEHNFM